MKALVIKNPFGGHERGDTVTDPHEIERILAGEHAQHISPIELDGPTAPGAEPAKKKSK